MQYVVVRGNHDDYEMFAENGQEQKTNISVITAEQFSQITEYLSSRNLPSLLAFQIGYYIGLRIGEVCGLTWQDINLEEQYLTVRRSITYNNIRNCTVIGPTKRKKIRMVDFSATLTEILKKAKAEQEQNRITYGELYTQNYYIIEKVNNRIYYDIHTLTAHEKLDEKFSELSLVCIRPNGAPPKDVQELLGHADLGTTMNIYTHGSRESKRNAVMLLDEAVNV